MPTWIKSFVLWLFSPLIRFFKWLWIQFKWLLPYVFALAFVLSGCFGFYAVYKMVQTQKLTTYQNYYNAGSQNVFNELCKKGEMLVQGKKLTCK